MKIHEKTTNTDRATDTDNVHFALLGDVEPKPDPDFSNLEKAVEAINKINEKTPFDFVAGIGDIPHKGTLIQYEGATESLKKLKVALFAIMGNEELGGGEELFLEYAARWNGNSAEQPQLQYTKYFGRYAYIFITATVNGVRFSETDLDWLEEQLQRNADRDIILFTHAPAKDIFPEVQPRSIPNERFVEILRGSNVRLQFSGHTHMDPDYTKTCITDPFGIHHVHIPGIERTKVGETHTPRFRTAMMQADGKVTIQTYNLKKDSFEEEHSFSFEIP